MKRIAVLTSCHNRREKTLACLRSLYDCFLTENVRIEVCLVDDGSTDGTSIAVKENFPQIKILEGDGNLFWAGGMRLAWSEALKQDYDGYLLLNDDTILYQHALTELLNAHKYSLRTYKRAGIYVGTTHDPDTRTYTYGGQKIVNRMTGRSSLVIPQNKMIQACDFANGNILLVSKNVVESIGILSDEYTHFLADYDYTLTASRKEFPVLVCSDYCGVCVHDHGRTWMSGHHPLSQRIRYLYDPKHLAHNEYLFFIWRYFPLYWPVSFLKLWSKTLFPSLWDRYKK